MSRPSSTCTQEQVTAGTAVVASSHNGTTSISTQHLPGFDQDSATLSDCGTYRYALTREWGPDPRAMWIMLNPSTADGATDDPTLRRCKAFSRSWGCGALTVVNLYAWRATDPAAMKAAGEQAVGPENDAFIRGAAREAAQYGWPLIAAWGANADLARVRAVLHLIARAGSLLTCLGTTKSGHPRHPLYVRGGTALVPFEMAQATAAHTSEWPATHRPRALDPEVPQ